MWAGQQGPVVPTSVQGPFTPEVPLPTSDQQLCLAGKSRQKQRRQEPWLKVGPSWHHAQQLVLLSHWFAPTPSRATSSHPSSHRPTQGSSIPLWEKLLPLQAKGNRRTTLYPLPHRSPPRGQKHMGTQLSTLIQRSGPTCSSHWTGQRDRHACAKPTPAAFLEGRKVD